MKRMKSIALLLAALMSLALLASCDNEGSGSSTGPNNTSPAGTGADGTVPVDTDPDDLDWITFTKFVAGPGRPPGANNEVVKMIEDMTKVKIEFEFVVGDMDSLVGIMLASDTYPDLIGAGQARSRFMSAGALIPLQDLIPQYSRLRTHFEPYYDKLLAASPDDNIYIMDIWGRGYGDPITTFYNGPAFWIQKDVLAWDGYSNPKTVDEFFGLLERYYNAHPTIDGQPTLPFEILSEDWRAFCLFNAPQHLMGAPNDGDVFVKHPEYPEPLKGNFEAILYQDTQFAKDYYFKLNEFFHKGLISPETFTRNYDQYLAQISTGRVLAMFDQQWNFQGGEDVLLNDKRYERSYVPIGLTFPGFEQWYQTAPSFTGGNGMGISKDCKDVHRAMLFMDTLLREDITTLRTWGLLDRDYYIDENGRYRRTQEQRDNYADPEWVINNAAGRLTEHFPKWEGYLTCGNTVEPGDQPEEILEGVNDYDKEFFSKYGFATRAEFLTIPRETPDYYPVWAFTIEDLTPARDAINRIQDLQRNHLPRVIMASDPEAAWAEYMGLLSNINTQAYLDEVNKQIAERLNK